ncbi:MAG: membrane protein insertion efficiency factor YidD, partial [Desulfobacteraceae bacterium]
MPHRCQNSISFRIKSIILLILKGYKQFISPCLPPACRFEPTCSVYLYQAIQK